MAPSRWRRAAAGGAVWLLAALSATPSAPSEIEDFRVTRTVEVERPGPVKLSLDLDDLREMLPTAGDLHVLSPEGVELPRRHRFDRGDAHRVPARLLAVDRAESGWQIRLDAGAGGTQHRALVFEMALSALAPGARLESSADGESWRLLAESSLFRVGDGEAMQRATLGYAPTTDRFLRLHWPGNAGFPEAERIALELVPVAPIEQRVEDPECHAPLAGEIVCRLRSEAGLAQRLSLEVVAGGAVAYRLSIAERSAWLPLGEGVWHLGAAASGLRVTRMPRLDQPAELRLELYGDRAAPPELAAYTFEYPSQSIYFLADEAGRYTLAIGGDRRPTAQLPEMTADDFRNAVLVEPGPAERRPPPPLPAPAVEARTPLPEAPFSNSWEVRAPRAEGAAIVHLPLPAEVLRVTRRGLPDLRLAVDDRQLPFMRWQPEAPAVVVAAARVRPRRAASERASLFELELPDNAVGLSQIELTTREGPFERRLEVRLPGDPRGKLGATGAVSPWTRWACPPPQPMPCRFAMPLDGFDGHGRLEIEIQDGDNAPLRELRIGLWRGVPGLVFAWPMRGSVRLVAGNPELAAPAYDLALLEERLSRREWLEASLDLAATAERRARADRAGRLLMMAALVLAAVFLLVLLTRLLRSPSA